MKCGSGGGVFTVCSLMLFASLLIWISGMSSSPGDVSITSISDLAVMVMPVKHIFK